MSKSAAVFYLNPDDRFCTDLINFLVYSQAEADGPFEMQVFDHANGDSIVIAGPRLTATVIQATMQEWTDAWWDDDDESKYGSTENYLSQFSRREVDV